MVRLLGVFVILGGIASVALAGTSAAPAPEIDASTCVAAIGLLGGGMLILRSRKK